MPHGNSPGESQTSRPTCDEIHNSSFDLFAAPTYDRLLQHLKPRFLLGLTATPERADGKSILDWFDERMAAELRLWHADARRSRQVSSRGRRGAVHSVVFDPRSAQAYPEVRRAL